MVVHLLSLGLTGVIAYLAKPGTDLFSWHPTLMTASFALLMAQAIVIFSPESSLLVSSSRQDKIQLHWILNLFSILGAAGGFGAVYLNKQIANKDHFTTWHGRIGLAAVLGVILAALFGIASKYSSNLRSFIKPINTKIYHATIALLVFTLGMSAMCLACYSHWLRRRAEGYLWRILFFTPVVLCVCMARQVTQSYLPRVAQPTPAPAHNKTNSTEKRSSKHVNKTE